MLVMVSWWSVSFYDAIVETHVTAVFDLVHNLHILAFQTLKFCKSLRVDSPTTQRHIILSCVLVKNVIIWSY